MSGKNRLRRQRGIIAGVCGGLGEFYGIAPFWFRLLGRLQLEQQQAMRRNRVDLAEAEFRRRVQIRLVGVDMAHP